MDFDYQAYIDFTNSDEYIALYDYYNQETFMDVLGVSRQENPHSSFLRWLFDPASNHGLGDYPLKKLIETLCIQRCSKTDGLFEKNINLFSECNIDKIHSLITENFKISNVSVEREKPIEKQRRADILITCDIEAECLKENKKIVILIENKIHSAENDNQTTAYATALFDTSNREGSNLSLDFAIPVYLLPAFDDELKNVKPSCGEFLVMNYQTLVDGVIEPCHSKKKSSYGDLLIDEYLKCLGKAISLTEDENGGRNSAFLDRTLTVMAISKREKQLVKELWSKHNAILKQVLDKAAKNLTEHSFTDKDFKFFCSVINALSICEKELFSEQDQDKENKDYINDIKNRMNSSINRETFLYKGNTYSSGKNGEKSLAFLARLLIIEYVEKCGANESIEDIREKIRKGAKISSDWHKEILFKDSDVALLKHCSLYNDDSCPFCSKSKGIYFLKNTVQNKKGEIATAQNKKDEIANDRVKCHLYDGVSTYEEFLNNFTDKSGKYRFYTCCREAFDYVFYNYETNDNGSKKSTDNNEYYKCSHGNEEYYVARFFGADKVTKFAELTGHKCEKKDNVILIK